MRGGERGAYAGESFGEVLDVSFGWGELVELGSGGLGAESRFVLGVGMREKDVSAVRPGKGRRGTHLE